MILHDRLLLVVSDMNSPRNEVLCGLLRKWIRVPVLFNRQARFLMSPCPFVPDCQTKKETEAALTSVSYSHLWGTNTYTRICPCGYPQVEVFHAVAATAENGEDGPYYLAVLIAYQLTAKSQVRVDYRGQNTVKYVQNEK